MTNPPLVLMGLRQGLGRKGDHTQETASGRSTLLTQKLMRLKPRQHLLEGSLLGLHDLRVIVFSNHSKAYTTISLVCKGVDRDWTDHVEHLETPGSHALAHCLPNTFALLPGRHPERADRFLC